MNDAPRVTADQLNERLEAGEDFVVLDVRRGSYERSDVKIKGAIRIEPDALAEEYEQLAAGATVVTYCT